jgi:serine/threonine protein phosphatase PrpC
MGELAISRALGDMDFKETGFKFVLSDPEIKTAQLLPQTSASTNNDVSASLPYDYLIVACDGVFDVMTNEAVCAYVHENSSKGLSVQDVADQMVRQSIEKLGTRDNVTALVIKIEAVQQQHQHRNSTSSPSRSKQQHTIQSSNVGIRASDIQVVRLHDNTEHQDQQEHELQQRQHQQQQQHLSARNDDNS